MGDYYRVPCDHRGLNYDKFFSKGEKRSELTEFNSNNTKLLTVEQVKEKLLTLKYIQERLAETK
jgi:UDP-glucose 4-epimerase